MRYAIISDIHANLPALQTVLRDAETHGCERIVCLGDLVGYYWDDAACLQVVRERAVSCVRGNFDDYASGEVDLSAFSPTIAEAVRRMRGALTSDDVNWLGNLPYVAELDGFTIVHASLDCPQRWQYVFDKPAAAASFPYQNTPLCFFGHTHIPIAFMRDSVVTGGTYDRLTIQRGRKYFINPGSVGQPRDNNPKASYAIYDSGEQTVELRRLDYQRPNGPDGDVVAGAPKPSPPLSGKNAEHF
jgi:predicted phosphodiesterase